MAVLSLIESKIRTKVLLATILMGLLARILFSRWLPIEDLQTALFPLFLFMLILVPRVKLTRTALAIPFILLLLWVVGAIHIRGYLGTGSVGHTIFISRLDGDPNGTKAREILNDYTLVAKHLNLPLAASLQRNFENNEEAESWLSSHSSVGMVVRGNTENLFLILSPYWSPGGGSLDNSRTILLTIPQTEIKLAYLRAPANFRVPVEPTALTAHFLTWVGAVFHRNNKETHSAGELRGLCLGFLDDAGELYHQGQDLLPRRAANLLSATVLIEDGLNGGELEDSSLGCAFDQVMSAMRHLHAGPEDAEFVAALFNNLGVLKAVSSGTPRALRDARTLFERATEMRTEKDQVPASALVAYKNLVTLDSSGAIPDRPRRRQRTKKDDDEEKLGMVYEQ